MNPVRITPPALPVVDLNDLKAHLRVMHSDEDALIHSMQNAAVAHLDGYHGILGRCIMPQTWRETFTGWGDLRLALPDVTEATVTYLDAEGDEQPADEAELRHDALGSYVTASGPQTDRVTVTYDCAIPESALPAVQAAVKLLVGHWYENREGVVMGSAPASIPLAFDALLSPVRRVLP
jgi:uncharacterized phiE125 gp8 family phage protein